MVCDVCGKSNKETRIINSKRFETILCNKHYVQMQIHDKIMNADKEKNRLILKDSYVEVVIIKNKQEYYVKIDNEDVCKIEKYKWHLNDSGYAVATINYKHIRMHKLIINAFDCEIDHENRDKIDNRKFNLRKTEHIDNSTNTPIRINNNSGIIGVSYDDKNNKWRSSITVNFKSHNLGRYINIEDAIVARLKAEVLYFNPEYAPQRHLFNNYNIMEDNYE